MLTFNSWDEWFVICWINIIIIIPSSGKHLKTHDLKLRITAKFQAHLWNLSWEVCILLSHCTVWLSHRCKDRVVWRSLSLGYVTDNGDKLRSSRIQKGCSILHDSRGTDGFLWCAAVALHVLVRTVLEAVASKELLTCHASTDVGNSVHTLLSVSHCKIAPYNNMKESVLAISHYFWWSTWSYVLTSFIYHLSNGMYFDRIPFWTESMQLPYFSIDNAHPKLFRHSFWCINNVHDAN
jgi:hypothetical protein